MTHSGRRTIYYCIGIVLSVQAKAVGDASGTTVVLGQRMKSTATPAGVDFFVWLTGT